MKKKTKKKVINSCIYVNMQGRVSGFMNLPIGGHACAW